MLLKIRPPNVFNKANAEKFLLKLSHFLANIDYEKIKLYYSFSPILFFYNKL
jgi:hypothetical protein